MSFHAGEFRRRPSPRLALAQPQAPRLAPLLVGLVLFLPTLGTSLVLVPIAERLLRRFSPKARRWLGLAGGA